MHSKNGNRNASKHLRIAHWNSGSAWMENKMISIKAEINNSKHDIFCISEANLTKDVEDYHTLVDGYQIVKPATLSNPELPVM